MLWQVTPPRFFEESTRSKDQLDFLSFNCTTLKFSGLRSCTLNTSLILPPAIANADYHRIEAENHREFSLCMIPLSKAFDRNDKPQRDWRQCNRGSRGGGKCSCGGIFPAVEQGFEMFLYSSDNCCGRRLGSFCFGKRCSSETSGFDFLLLFVQLLYFVSTFRLSNQLSGSRKQTEQGLRFQRKARSKKQSSAAQPTQDFS